MSFPVTYSTPSGDALAALLSADYDIGRPVSCHLLQRGLNDSFLVTAGKSRYVLRLYRRGWRSDGEISYEMDALMHLRRKGVPVCAPVPRKDGEIRAELDAPEGTRTAVLFLYAPGRELAGTPADSWHYGRAVAAVHAATDDFRTEAPRFALDLDHLLREPLAALRPALGHRLRDLAYLEELAATLRARIERLPAAEMDRGFCHGDFHGDNAHIDGETVTFFDFDCCGPGWRAYDIAVFRWRWGDGEKGEANWAAFLEGYRSLRRIGAVDLAAVPLFVALRAIWLRGLHVANVRDWGTSWLNDSYWDRLIAGLREWQGKHLAASAQFVPSPPEPHAPPEIAAAAVETDAPARSRRRL